HLFPPLNETITGPGGIAHASLRPAHGAPHGPAAATAPPRTSSGSSHRGGGGNLLSDGRRSRDPGARPCARGGRTGGRALPSAPALRRAGGQCPRRLPT